MGWKQRCNNVLQNSKVEKSEELHPHEQEEVLSTANVVEQVVGLVAGSKIWRLGAARVAGRLVIIFAHRNIHVA
jgi:hypothetical protein